MNSHKILILIFLALFTGCSSQSGYVSPVSPMLDRDYIRRISDTPQTHQIMEKALVAQMGRIITNEVKGESPPYEDSWNAYWIVVINEIEEIQDFQEVINYIIQTRRDLGLSELVFK